MRPEPSPGRIEDVNGVQLYFEVYGLQQELGWIDSRMDPSVPDDRPRSTRPRTLQ